MKEKRAFLGFILKRIKEGRLKEMWVQTRWIYGYARKYKLAMVFYTVLGMVNTVISLGAGLISKDLVDIITGHQTGMVITTFALMIGFNISNTVLNQIAGYYSNRISMKVDAEIKAEIFEKILVTDWELLTNYHTGDLLARWNQDVSVISDGVLNFIPNTIIDIFRFISAFAMVIYYDASFAIFAFLGMPVSLLMSRKLLRRMMDNNRENAAMGARISGFNQETFSNIQTIKAFNLLRLYVERLKTIQQEYIGMKLNYQKMSIITSLLMSAVGLMVSYSSYGWGIYRVWSGAITYGTMTMFLGLSGTLTGTVNSLASLVPSAINITTSAGRLMDIVEMPCEDYSNEEEVDEFYERNHDKGIEIVMDDISYSYQTGTEVFCGASLIARPHEIVALIGPSGEGKTTMMRLLLAILPIKNGEGRICRGNDSINVCPAARKLFSYVPQGNTMLSGTIAENMRNVKPDATDEEIIEALKKACAWEFVERLPDGINSEIKERGGGFSEGQAQRLSIARSLMCNSPILLMDEATSALDEETERKVLQNMVKDTYPRTCIVTTHRMSVIEICDRVYTIKDKKCIETEPA